jgi:hypothetical protein
MPPPSMNARRDACYKTLKTQFYFLRAILDPHLELDTLAEIGIDILFVDLHQETRDGGPYFLPMLQSRLESFHQLPDFNVGFMMESDEWSYSHGGVLNHVLYEQMTSGPENSSFRAIDQTQWRPRWLVLLPAESL